MPSTTPPSNLSQDDRLSGIVEALRARLEEASESMEILAEEKARLSEQVSAREEEIKRLGKQLGSDGHVDQVSWGPGCRGRAGVGGERRDFRCWSSITSVYFFFCNSHFRSLPFLGISPRSQGIKPSLNGRRLFWSRGLDHD